MRSRVLDVDCLGLLGMILTRLAPDAAFYRALTPRWAPQGGFDKAHCRAARISMTMPTLETSPNHWDLLRGFAL